MLAYVIDDVSGEELGGLLQELVDKRWTMGAVHKFALRGEIVFELSVLRHNDEPGRGRVTFRGVSPTWKELLNSSLRKGFRREHAKMMRIKLRDAEDSDYFRAFVMLHFEVARRVVSEDRRRFPDRSQTTDAIKLALNADNRTKYELLVEMFVGDQRMKRYGDLRKS